ncbi:MAG: TetR/AcrR family transcriptional regulator [Gemmatimonadales bacterium]
MDQQLSEPDRDPSGPRWQRRPEARADELVEAAVEVFGEMGFARAKLEDVARRAGVSKGTIYLYFESKEALFREMVRMKVGQHFSSGERILDDNPSAGSWDLLSAMMERWWSVATRPEMVRISRLMQGEITNFPGLARFFIEEVIVRNRRLIRSILQRGVDRGEFRAIPNDMAVRAISSLIVHGALYQRFMAPHDPEAIPDQQVIDGVLDFVRAAITTAERTPGKADA